MKTATPLLLLAVLALGWALPAQAQTQRNVVFQVDLNAAIDAALFDPAVDSVLVRGSMNDWSNSGQFDRLNDAGESGDVTADDGIYAGTLALDEGTTYNYKFWASPENDIGYENDVNSGNRSYTVTADDPQVIDVVDFNKPFGLLAYEIEFRVDMSVATLSGRFDPATDIVTVAGNPINGWSTTADTLQQDFINPDIYATVIEIENVGPGTEVAYKFVVGKPGEDSPQGWESIDDRKLLLTGDEPDSDGNGLLDAINGDPPPYLNNVTPDQVLTEETVVTFEVDMRPALYYLEDNGELPRDTQTAEPVTEFTGVFMNGPVAGNADGLTDWATWGQDLAAIASRTLVDDGTGGDAAAGDSIYTVQLTYPAGSPKAPIGKFGASGYDNEAGFGLNQNFVIDPDNAVVHAVFGAIRQADGDYTDDCGPLSANSPSDCTGGGQYDPYILIDNAAGTVTVVRSGGDADGTNTAVEAVGDELPDGYALGQNYPNPFNPATTFEYTVPAAQHVRIQVYDLMGRLVQTLVDGVQSAATYRVTFDGANLSSGLYVYRLETTDRVFTRTMVLLK